MSHTTKFATALDCADGRTKLPVRAWAREHLGVDEVDCITRPGMDKFLSAEIQPVLLEDLQDQLAKLEGHASEHVLVIGHCECLGNPVSEDPHREDIKKSCENVTSWRVLAGKKIIGLLVNKTGTWDVDRVTP